MNETPAASGAALVIVRYRLAEAPDRWPTVIGAPGASVEAVVEHLRARYGERLLEARDHSAPNDAQELQ